MLQDRVYAAGYWAIAAMIVLKVVQVAFQGVPGIDNLGAWVGEGLLQRCDDVSFWTMLASALANSFLRRALISASLDSLSSAERRAEFWRICVLCSWGVAMYITSVYFGKGTFFWQPEQVDIKGAFVPKYRYSNESAVYVVQTLEGIVNLVGISGVYFFLGRAAGLFRRKQIDRISATNQCWTLVARGLLFPVVTAAVLMTLTAVSYKLWWSHAFDPLESRKTIQMLLGYFALWYSPFLVVFVVAVRRAPIAIRIDKDFPWIHVVSSARRIVEGPNKA